MNVIESINNINESIQEADMAVLESMMHIIDKREMFVECNNDTLDEMFMESMSYFVEYSSKDKDEITKWMYKQGYWYEGDNPKKKKETMRMYHFLKQHDFRPSDQTYKTNIDDGKGGKVREKLLIDPGQNKNIVSLVGEKPDEDFLKLIRSGDNATFTHNTKTNDTEFKMSSKELKGKQAHPQFSLKHEEGHLDAFLKSGKKNVNSDDVTKNEALDLFYKMNQPKLNEHDRSYNELYADKYAAQHAKLRKTNGKSSNIKSHELLQVFRGMHMVVDPAISSIKKRINTLNKILSNMVNHLHDIEDLNIENMNIFDITDDFKKQIDIFNDKYQDVLGIVKYIQDSRKEMDKYIDKPKSSMMKHEWTQYYNYFESDRRAIDDVVKKFSPEELKIFKETIAIMKKLPLYIADITKDESKNETIKAILKSEIMKDKVKDKIDHLHDTIHKIKKHIESIKKSLKRADAILNESTNFRYEFAKQFVKEYFVELFDDMYITE